MPTTIAPLHNQVLVQMEELGYGLSDLHLPDNASERHPYGLVLACGPDVTCCAPSDRVLMLANNLVGFTLPSSARPLFLVTDKALLGKYVDLEEQLAG